jgi:CubicO group peptidase (beta-lactamase class C family)
MGASPWIRALQDAVDEGTIPGALSMVGRADDVRVETVGAMALGGPPMRADAIFRIQSMTKAVTAAATLLAVQAGGLSLEDPVHTWLPELADRVVLRHPGGPVDDLEPAHRPIVVRDLLLNASGYGAAVDESPWATLMREHGMEAGPEPPSLGADEWLAALAELPLVHHPGEGFRYHHSFAILGILLQRFSGVPLQDHLERVLLGPLGMVDTGLTVPASQAHRLPAAYRLGAEGLQETEPVGGGFYVGPAPFDTAHGELVSTASDYHRFLRMLAAGGRIDGVPFLDPRLVEQMTTDQTAARAKTPESFFPGFWDTTGWGYGVGVTVAGGHVGRYGWSGGQGTTFFVDPDGTVATLLTQVEMGERMFGLLDRFQELARVSSPTPGHSAVPHPDAPRAGRWDGGAMSENPADQGTSGQGYDPAQDPDADPEMLTEQHPDHVGENQRDPAEGADDESATDG